MENVLLDIRVLIFLLIRFFSEIVPFFLNFKPLTTTDAALKSISCRPNDQTSVSGAAKGELKVAVLSADVKVFYYPRCRVFVPVLNVIIPTEDFTFTVW